MALSTLYTTHARTFEVKDGFHVFGEREWVRSDLIKAIQVGSPTKVYLMDTTPVTATIFRFKLSLVDLLAQIKKGGMQKFDDLYIDTASIKHIYTYDDYCEVRLQAMGTVLHGN